jgi:hypothetical protein
MTTVFNRNLTELARGETDFGILDKQGRAVGYAWRVSRAVFTPAPEGQRYGYTDPTKWDEPMPREHLTVSAFPTRNGKHYGASGHDLRCLTQAEAAVIIEKRTAQARKRDTKKFKV